MDDPGCLWRQVHQLLNPGSGFRHGQLLQKTAQLHDKSHLTGRKNLPDGHGRDQRQRHQHVRFDIKRRHQADDGLQNDRHTAQDDGHPSHIQLKRQ